MARYIYQGTTRDQNGAVVTGATVSVYKAGTTTAASVYTSTTSSTAVNSVISNAIDGAFEFYTDDFDYDHGQLFKITISKDDFTSVTYDYIKPDVVLKTYTISEDTTVSTQLYVPKGVVYSVDSGKTLTLNGDFDAGLYQIFSGDGTVSFGGSVAIDFPEWRDDGSGTSATATALQRKQDVSDDGTIDLTPGSNGGMGMVSAGGEAATFVWGPSYASLTLLSNTANIASSDSDANLCVYNYNSDRVRIKNRLGGTKKVTVVLWGG